MPPVLPTERIAHLGTADCCIHPSGRNEMTAITPPKIFSKEVAQNRPPHFPASTAPITRNSFRANFRGCGLNQSSNFAALPTGGVAAHTTSRPVQKRQCSVSSKLL